MEYNNNLSNNLMKELGGLISADKIDYTSRKKIKDITEELSEANRIPRLDKEKAAENILRKYEQGSGETKAPKISRISGVRAVTAVMVVLFSLNIITIIFAKTDLATYLYDFNNGVLTIRRAEYNVEEKNTEYSRYFTSVYDGVKYFGADIPLPHRLPAEYNLNKVYCSADKERISISYISKNYENDRKEISYCVLRTFNNYLEVDEDEEPKVIEYNGNTYYVMHNINRVLIQWIYNDMNCYITSTMSEEELFEIIKNMR